MLVFLGLVTANHHTLAVEKSNQETAVVPVVTEAAVEIKSPLVSVDVEHGQLHLSAFDPGHQLYPVKIISIDDWTVTAEITAKELLLAPAEHSMRVVPDFSAITPQMLFMSSPWQEKHLSFTISPFRTYPSETVLAKRAPYNTSIYCLGKVGSAGTLGLIGTALFEQLFTKVPLGPLSCL